MKKPIILLIAIAASAATQAQCFVGGSVSVWHSEDAGTNTYRIAL